jgi:glycosyltransferase involved in cell wall biosynthesis
MANKDVKVGGEKIISPTNKEISRSVYRPRSVFVTSNFVQETEESNASHHEARALSAVTHLVRMLTLEDINRKLPALPTTTHSFLCDYFTAHELKSHKVELAFFNGSPFGMTMRVLKPAKTIVAIALQNMELSKEEFKRQNGKGLFPFDDLTDPFLWNIYFQHIHNADVVLCPSKLSAVYISTKLKLKNRMAVIPYGCYLPEENQIHSPEDFCVVHIGDNVTDKGQFYLARAWHKLTKNPQFSGRLVMVGRGTNIWAPFEVFSSEHIGDVGKVYCDCSIYVQPSVTESFGIPVLEAMSYARPVIVSEGAGACDLVEDGKEGFIVPIRDPDAVKKKIEYFHDNPDEVKRMGKNARKKAEKYSWEIIEKKYQKLIKEVLREYS